MPLPRLVAVAAAVAIVLTGCGGTDDRDAAPTPSPSRTSASSAPPTEPATGDGPRYVALGDSFVSGPGILPEDPASGRCYRSDRGYPALLAAATGAELRNVSCAGATTTDVLEDGALPAQLAAVDADTQLVTLGIGGNDGGLFTGLVTACAQQDAGRCGDFVSRAVTSTLARTEQAVARTIREVSRRAPDAQVLLVGYLPVLPASAGCASVPISGADVPDAVAGEEALDDTLAAAARAADVTFVSMREAGRGHDACAGDDAWTNGIAVEAGDGSIFHPRARGMQAVADAVAAAMNR
jgi:lysophospholipase L1-like esterase